MPWISAVMQSAFAGCLIAAASGVAIRNCCWTANRSVSFLARQKRGNMSGLECMANTGPCQRRRVTY
jgi:hypothetical protein